MKLYLGSELAEIVRVLSYDNPIFLGSSCEYHVIGLTQSVSITRMNRIVSNLI
jgi:hypothetical protein